MCEHNKNEQAYCAYCAVSRVRTMCQEWIDTSSNETAVAAAEMIIRALDGEKK